MTERGNDLPARGDEIDAQVREALRDDLPPEVEARLTRAIERFVTSKAESKQFLGWMLFGAGGWAMSQRTVAVVAALLLACGLGLQATSDPIVLTESLSNLSASASLVRSIRSASSVTCTGLLDAELATPGALADRVHTRWVLVRIAYRPDAVVSEFRALDEPAHYQLLSDDLSHPPREILKIPLKGAAPDERDTQGYRARCVWEVPRAGLPGLVFLVRR